MNSDPSGGKSRICWGACLPVKCYASGCLVFGDAARTREQVRVVQAPALDRVGQRPHDVFLPGQFAESLRSPLAGENLIAH